ncbi:membrane protein [Enterococcus alcedinis]|uniref:Membrane protein n=2 Tax=Enterococcus alcedinis TaxID=1274384 RepID=A0A917N3T8_9ENTE|nr:YitT family protein [Enterococcus alcedinis]GGI64893.1 membrane protein [Enterococcus alcedinis]
MKKEVQHFGLMLLAILILAVSVNMFLGPHHIAAGGVSGIGILLESLIGMNRAWVVMILNGLMLVLAAIFLGKTVFLRTLLGSILFPLSLRIVPQVMLTQDRLLSVIMGSVIFAAGVAILYRIQSSSGGTTIPPLILKKYFNINTSIGLLFTDMLIVFMSLYVFGFEEFLFAILSIGITSLVMNYIETGLKRRKAVMILSLTHSEAIRAKLLEEVDRGMTLFDVRGGKNQTSQNMILTVIKRQEYPKVLEIIETIDPKCFVIVYEVSEVHGLGFTYQPIQ